MSERDCGTMARVWRYPVKSMRGETLEAATLSERGIAGDRVYAVRDQVTEKIASAKHPRVWGHLLQCVAQTDPTAGVVRVTLPDGQRVTAGQPDAEAALRALTGRTVALVTEPRTPPVIERYWPDVDGLTLHDTVTTDTIGLGAPAGTFFDFAPLHLLTTATLAHLARLYPAGQVDARRFRPNLVIETPAEVSGFVENAWVGCTLLVGEARLRITTQVPRCVVPTLPQGPLAGDLGILRAVADHNRPPVAALEGARVPCLGVYALVERGGVVCRGDAVRLADAA